MKTWEYFEKRALETEYHSKQRGERYLSDLKKSYELTKEQLKKDIKTFYKKYADELEKITNIDARKSLTQGELLKYLDIVKQKINNSSMSEFEKKLYRQKYLISRLNRDEALLKQLELNMDLLTSEYEKSATEHLIENYKQTYCETAHALFNSPTFNLNLNVSFNAFDNRAIETIVKTKWSNKSFSQRIWGHKKNSVREIKNILNVGITLGYSVDKMSKQVAERLDVNYSNAKRLIRTESNYILSEATNNLYQDAELEKYRFLAVLDYKTSLICQSLDNKIFNVKDRKIGVNCNPMHPNCRSTTVPHVPEYEDLENETRLARDIDGKTYKVPADFDYKKWYESMTNQQKQSHHIARKSHQNKATDKRQYERYKEVIPKENMPKSLAEYQKLKYTDKKGYEDLKLAYKDEKLKTDIRNSYNLNINKGRQDKHIKGTNNYNTDLKNAKINSYLLNDINPQELVNKYAGTGEIKRDRNGRWTNKEFVEHVENIGYIVNPNTNEEVLTNRFTIHYSKIGTHIVPAKAILKE